MRCMTVWRVVGAALFFVGSSVHTLALDTSLTAADMARALALGRNPGGTEAVLFQKRYVPNLKPVTVQAATFYEFQITTEFRRLVLLAAAPGFSSLPNDIEKALQPWHRRVLLGFFFRLRPGTNGSNIPAFRVEIDGPNAPVALSTKQTTVGPSGGIVESDFDAEAVGNMVRQISLHWAGTSSTALTTVDFLRLE